MNLTVQELIFKTSLENKDYDKALNDVKNIFALSKKQVQLLLDNIVRIKENIMTFTAEDYEKSIQDSIKVIKEQDDKFKAHKDEIEKRERDLKTLHLEKEDSLDNEEKIEIFDKLENLGEIKKELSKNDRRLLKVEVERGKTPNIPKDIFYKIIDVDYII